MQPDQLSRYGYRQELTRSIGLPDQVYYGLIFMVPIAPFAIFGAVYATSGGMPVLAYTVGLVAMLFTAASYTQMVKAFPLAGSVYNYAGRGISAPVGFITGWAILLDYILVPGLLYLVAAVAMNATVPQVPVWAWLVGFVLLNTIINLRGIRMTFTFIKVMIAAELAVLVLFLGVGVWAVATGRGHGFSLAPLFNSHTFSVSVVFGAVSVAALSFLGFDGITMLVEEAKGGAAQVGRATKLALILAGVLFIAQVWVAAMLVPDPAGLLAAGDPNGTAFYDAATVAGGHWLSQVTSTATAISWGLADTLVAQVAITRLLYAMARDRQLPKFLARVSVKRAVPANATIFVAILSTALGLWMASRADGIGLLASLINMGAMCAFVVLHVSVIVHYLFRARSRNLWSHLLVPVIGATILGYVIINANILAQTVGLVWIGIGVLVLIGLYLAGRRPVFSRVETIPTDTYQTAQAPA
jgi:amino acid transporter